MVMFRTGRGKEMSLPLDDSGITLYTVMFRMGKGQSKGIAT